MTINLTVTDFDITSRDFNYMNITAGGFSSPNKCVPLQKVAIIVPYRNRENQLKIFVRHMHKFLYKQQIEYGIYLIEPVGNITFNRALLLNIGFNETLKLHAGWQCFIFHDIDKLPEVGANHYSCQSDAPNLMSSAMSTFCYKLPYGTFFGGVVSVCKKHMIQTNGYSNLYFGWGAEGIRLKTLNDLEGAFVNFNIIIG